MGNLQESIDKAVAEQYPDGNKPTFLIKAHKKSDKERWVEHFMLQLKSAGFTIYNPPHGVLELMTSKMVLREFRFHPERMWRFDFAIPYVKIGIEVDGGSFGRPVQCHKCKSTVMRATKSGRMFMVREGGRHNTGAGMEADHEKMNEAAALGWRILRAMPKHIKDSSVINLLTKMI